ncbi:MAG: hypothetical protein R2748_02085 [Bryobacterales bacterium]
MLEKFAFGVIQVIDLTRRWARVRNDAIVRDLAKRATTRRRRRPTNAPRLVVDAGASRVIVGTAAFSGGRQRAISGQFDRAVGRDEGSSSCLDTKEGRITTGAAAESNDLTAKKCIRKPCRFLRRLSQPPTRQKACCKARISTGVSSLRTLTCIEITAAGGITTIAEIQELARMNIHLRLAQFIRVGSTWASLRS